MMLKYIQKTIDSLKGISSGIKKNPEKWASLPVNATEFDEAALTLEKADAEINSAEQVLEQKREAARKLVDLYTPKLRQAANLAIGIHSGEEIKLSEYGLSVRRESVSHSIPTKSIILGISDESDGIGFIISIATQPEADHYEIERGVAPNVNELVLQPPFPLYKTTLKTAFVDDDVKKGVRYFYRVRAINSAGSGEWSESVNRVQ